MTAAPRVAASVEVLKVPSENPFEERGGGALGSNHFLMNRYSSLDVLALPLSLAIRSILCV